MVAVEDKIEGWRPGGRCLGQRKGGANGGGDEVAMKIFGSLMWKGEKVVGRDGMW
jgi:hypothetical protein